MLEIVSYPRRILHTICRSVSKFDRELSVLADEMVVAMLASHGVGLAAPQVNRNVRVIVAKNSDPVVMVNPVIEWSSDEEIAMEEGCLSLPGIRLSIKRPKSLDVRYQDITGAQHRLTCDGLLARIVQHEVDHLDGVMFFDRAGVEGLRRVSEHMLHVGVYDQGGAG